MSTEPLWTAASLIEAMGATFARALGGLARSATGVVDRHPHARSRVTLFVAITGEVARDGHDFVAAALDKRQAALAALVDGGPHAGSLSRGRGRSLVVRDVRRKAWKRRWAWRAARTCTQARVVGVTGSVGKTGTKEALRTGADPARASHACLRSRPSTTIGACRSRLRGCRLERGSACSRSA
jgi:UDP-N-acetylmuramoyl-tripeptide--D-alanyl-D-alanine ligase